MSALLERREEIFQMEKRLREMWAKQPEMPIVSKYNSPADRNYDFDKIPGLKIGDDVTIKFYSTGTFDNILCGCYRQATGKITEMLLFNTVQYIVLDSTYVFSLHRGADFQLTIN